MRIAVVIAISAAVLGALVATAAAARTTVESQAVCGALRVDVGTAAFATGFKSAVSCRAEAASFELRTDAAVRRVCKGDAACMSALTEKAAAAARLLVLPMQVCTSRYGSASLTSAFVKCLVSTFRNELNTSTKVAVKCATHVRPSQFAGCLAAAQPAPAPAQPAPPAQTTVPTSPAPAPADRCSSGGTGFGPGVECPMASPAG